MSGASPDWVTVVSRALNASFSIGWMSLIASPSLVVVAARAERDHSGAEGPDERSARQ